MNAERKKIVLGKKIEEYYWHGDIVVYVDNVQTDMKYDDIKDECWAEN